MKRRIGAETVKTAAIVVLSVSAIFLASLTGIFDDFAAGLKRSQIQQRVAGSPNAYDAAAFPQSAAVTAGKNLRCGVKYNQGGMDELYKSVSTAMGEAIGSAAQIEHIDEGEWRNALDGEGLYIDYEIYVPFDALALWLGTEPGGVLSGSVARLLFIPGAEGSVDMCYQSEEGFFRCTTMSRWNSIAEQTVDFLPNGASFAYERESLADADPYCLISGGDMEMHGVHVSAGMCGSMGEVFGMSMYNGYTETDGTVVYPEDSGTLKLSADGTVSYTAGENGGIYADGLADMIESVRAMLERLRSGGTGEESLCFTGAEEGADGEVRLNFAYFINGIRVTGAWGDAAAVEFKNGRLMRLRFLPRIYTVAEQTVFVLPELQAAAAAGSMHKGGSAVLRYGDSGGEGVIFPVWKMSNGY